MNLDEDLIGERQGKREGNRGARGGKARK